MMLIKKCQTPDAGRHGAGAFGGAEGQRGYRVERGASAGIQPVCRRYDQHPMMIWAYPEAYPEAKIFLDRGLIFLYNAFNFIFK